MKRMQIASGLCVALVAPYIAALNSTDAKSLQIVWSVAYVIGILAILRWGRLRSA